ncbi:amidohydrolase family protein, partial [Acinetobacter baumannii]
NFVQVLLLSRNVEPLGQRRYWPIYEAAQEVGLPIGVHAFGFGGNPITASGWPSHYIEEMVGHSQCQQTALASLVLEGVFERF